MKEELQKYISNSLEILEHTLIELQSSGKNQFILLDKKYFHKKFMNEVNISEDINEFRYLKNIKKPVLYWFELASSNNNEAIRNAFIKGYREPIKKDLKTPYRNTSSYKKKYETKSTTL
jgi:hypothetical protein